MGSATDYSAGTEIAAKKNQKSLKGERVSYKNKSCNGTKLIAISVSM